MPDERWAGYRVARFFAFFLATGFFFATFFLARDAAFFLAGAAARLRALRRLVAPRAGAAFEVLAVFGTLVATCVDGASAL